ncbi:Gcn5-related n-acetyltransferase [Phytophthora palmivora]|uniref:Gcn5-related n-acetyltransferase n=1 Tax=Phytophthora palmivora TaxID=4796 RepID=A0A2P4XM81_9STRA|nr:Gcn5-related n-acetyltransferase [Phytophthora palmivora]
MTISGNSAPTLNEFGQPVGFALKDWCPPPFPPHKTLTGRYCSIEPLKADCHAQDVWNAQADDPSGARWTYLPNGPFSSLEEFETWCRNGEHSTDPQFYAVVVNGRAVGVVAYLRIVPNHGVIEIGHIYYSSQLAKTRAATEAMYLLAVNAFQLGYRRYEWKCDSLNLPSRNAAARLGFTYEGTFRQLIVYKGRNRDTSWFSITDGDWNGGLKSAYERWLEPNNFDENGQQKLKLSELTASFVHGRS